MAEQPQFRGQQMLGLSYFGFGGGLGFGTPVVSYAPLPMLQMVEDWGVSIMLLARWTEVRTYARDEQVLCRQAMTQADSQMSKSSS